MFPLEDYQIAANSWERAYWNIMNEMFEHAIEGVCVDVHRAVTLGYFPLYEYVVNDKKFEVFHQDNIAMANGTSSKAKGDIFNNNKKGIAANSKCPFCKQQKDADTLARHYKICRERRDDNTTLNNDVGYNSNDVDRRSGNVAKKAARNALNYETMAEGEIRKFLEKHCGVVSLRTRNPCRNKKNCIIHIEKDKEAIRRRYFNGGLTNGCSADQRMDGNIDINPVDE